MTQIRQHVFYSGYVQGVGFRYNAVRCSRSFEVTGFVRNLPDGRVELVAEGEKGEVDGLLAAIRDSMSGNIANTQAETGEPTGEFRDFHIGR